MKQERSILLILVVAAGCSSSIDHGQVQSMSCPDLNVAIGGTAKDISRAAIRRGNVRSYDVPFWVLGANRAKQALVERDTRRIEEFQATQGGIIAERDRRCG